MEIFRASPTDAPCLSAIAWEAKAYWGYPSHWLEQWRDQLTISPEFIEAHDTFAARLDRKIVAFYSLLLRPDGLHLEHLWVLPEWIGRGIGRHLFAHATALALGRGARALKIEADPHAEPFYLHLGAVRVGTSTSEIGGQRRELPLLIFALR